MSEKRSSYQYRQSLSFIDQKPKFLQNFLKPPRADRSDEEIEKLKKERNKDDSDDEQPQIVVLNEGKDLSREEMEQYLLNNPDKKISEEIKKDSKEKESEDSRFNKIFQNKKTTYDKDYKETGKDTVKNSYIKNNDIDYNEYTFGNEIKRDSSPPQKVIFRKPTLHKEDNDLISSSKGVKRKNIEEKNEKEVHDKNLDNDKKQKSKKHKKAKKQKVLLSFSMDDE